MRKLFILVAPLCGVLAPVYAAPADDVESLEEIIVTASLRAESAAELPSSVTVLESQTLRSAGLQHFEDVLGLVPNLNWSAGTSRPRYFQLRGIGELEQFQGAPNASVGVLIDDIDYSGIGMPATLFDVEQIEVLRGPQGTTYGANALAGLIAVRTRAPTPELDLKGEMSAGDHGTLALAGVIGGPTDASGHGAFRLVAQRYRSDGFRRNVFLHRDDTNGYDETTLRGRYRWESDGPFTLDLTAMLVDLDNGYDAFAIDNSRVTHSDKPGRDVQRSRGIAARIDYSGFDAFIVRSITTAADSDIVYSFDGDWGNDPEWGIYAPYDFTSTFVRDRRTFSQEIRFLSAPAAHIGWVAGLYALDSRETGDQLDVFNGFESTLESRYDATNAALYGQLDIPLAERVRLDAGVRIERRTTDYRDSNDTQFDPAETMSGGHVSVELAAAPRRHYYATLSRGYKAGNFNIGAQVPPDRRSFDAEFLWNMEAGVKLASEDNALQAQLALFHMRREDQQVPTSLQLREGDPLSFIIYTDNAARGENSGLEASAWWRATGRLELGGTLGLLHTRYVGYQIGDRSLDGREQAHAPEYQASLSAQYRHPEGLMARVDLQSVDDFYFDTSHDERAPAYTLVNLKLGYERGTWAAYAWVRNLFDEDYATRGFYFGNEPTGDPAAPEYPPKRYVQLGDSRQMGVTINYSFH